MADASLVAWSSPDDYLYEATDLVFVLAVADAAAAAENVERQRTDYGEADRFRPILGVTPDVEASQEPL